MSIFIGNYKIAMLQGSDFFPILGIQEFNEKLIPSKNLLYHELRGERLIELIICTGKLTKKIDLFQAEDKEYTGTITLGATTPSFDLETEIDQTFDISGISDEMIRETAQSFLGEISQFPPAHSALKINGERVYEKARRGEEVELKPRTVFIHDFDIEKIELPLIHFRIKCAKGTYIRSIAHDFGKKLNNGAHLSSLRRTMSGELHVDNAWNLEDLIQAIRAQKVLMEEKKDL